MSKKTGGYAAAIVSALMFGIMPLLTLVLSGEGITTPMIAFVEFLFMAPIFLVLLLLRKKPFENVTLRVLGQILILSLLGGVLTTNLLYASYQYIDTGVAEPVHFSYPIFVLAAGVLLFKDRLTKTTAVCFVLCAAGIAAFFSPGASFSLKGFLLALVSGVTYAAYTVYLERNKALAKLNIIQLTFFFTLFNALLTSPITAASGAFAVHYSLRAWLYMAGFSLLVGCGGMLLFQMGVRAIGGTKTSLLSTFEPITTVVVGAVFLGEGLSARKIIGCALVIAAVVLMICSDMRAEKAAQNR